MSGPVLNGINLVAADLDATLAFYRRLGIEIPEDAIWRTGTGIHHVTVAMPGGLSLEFDSEALAAVYDGGFDAGTAGSGRMLIGFSVSNRDDVDALHADLVAAGYASLQAPWDAFWGARAAVVADPDGNHVGLQSPADAERRTAPPAL